MLKMEKFTNMYHSDYYLLINRACNIIRLKREEMRDFFKATGTKYA